MINIIFLIIQILEKTDISTKCQLKSSISEQTPLKGSGLVSGRWVLLVSMLQTGRLLLSHLQSLCSKSELYSMLSSGSGTGRSWS